MNDALKISKELPPTIAPCDWEEWEMHNAI